MLCAAIVRGTPSLSSQSLWHDAGQVFGKALYAELRQRMGEPKRSLLAARRTAGALQALTPIQEVNRT